MAERYDGPIEIGSEWVNDKGRRVKVVEEFIDRGLPALRLAPLSGGRSSVKDETYFRWEFHPAPPASTEVASTPEPSTQMAEMLKIADRLGKMPGAGMTIHARRKELVQALFPEQPSLAARLTDDFNSLPVFLDDSVPPNVVQFRDADGAVVHNLVEIGDVWYSIPPTPKIEFAIDIDDYRGRLTRAADELEKLEHQAEEIHHYDEYIRLQGKVEGVKLAIDYLRGY